MLKVNFSTPKQANFRISENFNLSASRISYSANASLTVKQKTRKSLSLNSPLKPAPVAVKQRRSFSVVDEDLLKILSSAPDDPLFDDLEENVNPNTSQENHSPSVKENPAMARIMRDLNSPSATARSRALKALKSPTFKKANYEVFDIPHEQQDLVTSEERNAKTPEEPKSIEEVFNKICVYVEVRTGEDNRTAGIKKVISGMGAKVNDKLYKDTTHVIFKDGLQSTYNKAKKMNIPIVSILWIDACKKQMRIVDSEKYQISNKERYENPELFKKIRRPKSMQPDVDDPVVTPKSTSRKKTPKAIKLTDKSDSNISQGSNLSDVSEIPNSQPMDLDTPRASMRKIQTPKSNRRRTILPPTSIQADIINESDEKKRDSMEIEENENAKDPKRQTVYTPNPMEETNCNAKATTSAIKTTRRRTLFTPEPMDYTEIAPQTPLQVNTRRKSILDNPKDILRTPIIMQSKTPKTYSRKLQIDKTPNENLLKTPMSVGLPSKVMIPKSATKTPLPCSSQTPKNTPSTSISKNPQTPIGFGFGKSNNTPANSSKTLLEQYTSGVMFDSENKRSRFSGRMSINDISMDIIEQRVKQINKRHSIEINKSPSLLEKNTTPREKPLDLYFRQQLIKSSEKSQKFQKICSQGEAKELLTQVDKSKQTEIESEVTQKNQDPPPIKKRKLFNIEDSLCEIETENMDPKVKKTANKRRSCAFLNLEESVAKKQKDTEKTKVNRRRTLDFFALDKAEHEKKMLHNLSNRNKTPRPLIMTRPPMFVVGTSLHKEQIEKTKEVLAKLGNATWEDKISDKTTHLITLDGQRTMNLLRGIMRGLFIMNFDWILKSDEANQWLREGLYEFSGVAEPAQIVRSNKQTLGKNYSYDLFYNYQPFYICVNQVNPKKLNYLKELILSSKGRLATRPAAARFIITETPIKIDPTTGVAIPEFNVFKDKIVYATPEWIFDCIYRNKDLNYRKYAVREVKNPQIGTPARV